MNAIRIRKKLESESLYLPELRSLVGKTVEIIVLEEEVDPVVMPGTANFEAFPELAQRIREDYDFDTLRKQREYDLLHTDDHFP
jgi:hypothetical protein